MHIEKKGEKLFALSFNNKNYLIRTYPFSIFELISKANADLTLPKIKQKCSYDYQNYFNLELIVTTNCNLACKYCHVREGGGYYGFRPQNMQEKAWQNALDFVFDYISKNAKGRIFELDLYFLGGEPLINFEAVKDSFLYAEKLASKLYKKKKIKVNFNPAISTNGTLLNYKIVKFLTQKNFEISITIDGLHHDEHRIYSNNKGTLRDILKNFEIFRKLKYKKVKLFSVVPPIYAKEISKIIKFYKDNNLLSNAYRVSIVPRAVTREDTNRGCSIPKFAFKKISSQLATYDKKSIKDFSKQVEIIHDQYGIDDRNLCKKIKILIEKGGVAYRCPAALWKISVVPDGSIWPCHQLVNIKEFYMGNILKPLNNKIFCGVKNKFKKRITWKIKPCKNCVLQTLCPPLVDCPARSYLEEGTLYKAPHIYCQMYKNYLLKRFTEQIHELTRRGLDEK